MRAVIAEDQALLREGLVFVVESAGFEIAGTADDGPSLLEITRTEKPDLVVTDIRMPPTFTDEGLVAALEIRRTQPTTSVLVLSQFVQRRYALELVRQRGAGVGYLLKQRISDIGTFRADLKRICAGGTVLDPEVVARFMDPADSGRAGLERITPRQRDVLGLMAAGRSNASIARELVITEKAVVHHASRIYDVLGLPPSADDHRRVLAVIQYLTNSE
jgi:DNA-binding NarL/FixJ family response regulator